MAFTKNFLHCSTLYIVGCFLSIILAALASWVIAFCRTLFIYDLVLNDLTGLCVPAMFLLLCSFYGNTSGWAITFLTLSVGTTSFGVAGYHVNYLDISPKYAGILMGISNTIATIPGFVGPQVAKIIAKEVNKYSSKS